MKVIVAEDSEAVRTRIVELLEEQERVEVTAAVGSGSELEEAVGRHGAKLLLLDLFLTDGPVLPLVRRLREAGFGGTVAVFTAYAEEEIRERCLAAGADHFFSKVDGVGGVVELVRKTVADDES